MNRKQFFEDYDFVERSIRNRKNMLMHFPALWNLIKAFGLKHSDDPICYIALHNLRTEMRKTEDGLFDPDSEFNKR